MVALLDALARSHLELPLRRKRDSVVLLYMNWGIKCRMYYDNLTEEDGKGGVIIY